LRDQIAIVNYGMGNIKSLTNALDYLNASYIIASEVSRIDEAEKIILPGVGSFNHAIQNIKKLSLFDAIKEAVLIKRKPILGICLGMQILCESSSEDGFTEGFGFIKGKIEKFESKSIKIPHMGFNEIQFTSSKSKLFNGIEEHSDFYFTHSYKLNYLKTGQESSTCIYEDIFTASVEYDNIFGTQFHPEKSQSNGLILLKNYLSLND